MGKAILKEFKAHPLGTMAVVFTCFAFMAGGVMWVKAEGAEANQLKNDINSIAGSVDTVATKVEKHIEDTSYEKQVEQFPTRREYSDTIIRIDNSQKRIEADMMEQRKMSIEILKRVNE